VKAEEALNVVMDQLVLVNEKLGVVGSLTRHDVGNKLMAAKSNLYLLKKRIGDNPDLAKYLDGIDCALASSSEIFEFSRLYERIGVEKASKENVFDCFNQAVSLIPNLNNLEVVNECQGLVVVADSLLKQLLYNFIDNSIKHGGKVTQIRLHYSKDGDELKLFYEDNGVGIPEANKSRLFDSGFTTGNGSGLGLYLIKKMMDVYGWTITENGEPGKGAKFVMATPKLNKSGKENYQLTQ
jgi:signal transduction histidine kinase